MSIIRIRILRELYLKRRYPVHLNALKDRFKWLFLEAYESGPEYLLF